MALSRIRLWTAVLCVWALTCHCAHISQLRPPRAQAGSAQKSRLTPGMVKKTIKTGATTQTEIIATFGSPNIVTRDKAGREVWTYDVQRVSYSAVASERAGSLGVSGAGIIDSSTAVGGAAGVSGQTSGTVGQVSSSTFTLMITFDENETVTDYKMMSTQF